MCTALTWQQFFGRNLDLEYSYQEQVVIIPRNYPLVFRLEEKMDSHFAFLGVATIIQDTPLFYDGCNEYGLAVAGLNFPNNATYFEKQEGKLNLAPYEIIPYLLGSCKSLQEARAKVEQLNLYKEPFAKEVPNSPLHFMVSDQKEAFVIESCKDGLHIYENPAMVFTNNPPFNQQLLNLSNYQNLSNKQPEGNGCYENYCVGLGAVGLPGDASSMSRFVRIYFLKEHSTYPDVYENQVGQFFHLLHGVEMSKGSVLTSSGMDDYTVYTSCMDLDKIIYYYTTYTSHQIHGIALKDFNLEENRYKAFPLSYQEEIVMENM